MSDESKTITAFPLQWPAHRKRTQYVARARFHRKLSRNDNGYRSKELLTIAESRDRVYKDFKMLGGSGVVISSNLELNQNGQPRSNQREPSDPGVAVYSTLNKQPHCLSCDAWDRCADNLAAIAKHVEAQRGQLRWGVADVASMFAGFKSLPAPIITEAPMTVEQAASLIVRGDLAAAKVLIVDADTFRSTWRDQAKQLHPDANGGIPSAVWLDFQKAVDVLKQHHGI